MPRSAPDKLDKVLIPRLLEGQILPFIGAGVSRGARIPGRPGFEPSVPWMARRLHCAIAHTLRHRQGEAPPYVQDLLRESAACPDKSFTNLAEAMVWLCGQAALCRVLYIREFCDLHPLPAHHYLAWLAREGLVREIVSTNYDCCIERAMAASFGRDWSAKEVDGIQVIYDLDTYRKKAGKRRKGDGRPVLRLYKINGCAQALAEDQAGPDHIILTERQLQQFGPRQWARDLLADRARRLGFLFCGFGADEPQVRRTAMNIMAEFEDPDGDRDGAKTAEETALLANAPFVAVYEPEPLFAQMQILTGFYRAHLGCDCDLAAVWESLLTGADAEVLGFTGSNHLSADDFFGLLYAKAMLRLIHRHLGTRGVFRDWLRRVSGDAPGAWMGPLQNCDPQTDILELLRFEGQHHPPPLLSWLAAIQDPQAVAGAESPPYTSITEDPLFFLSALLLLGLLDGLSPTGTASVTPWGLEITLEQEGTGSPLRLHLIREGLNPLELLGDIATPRRLLYFITLPSLRESPREGRWENAPQDSTGLRPLYLGRFRTLSLEEFLARAEPDRIDGPRIRRLFASSPHQGRRVRLQRTDS